MLLTHPQIARFIAVDERFSLREQLRRRKSECLRECSDIFEGEVAFAALHAPDIRAVDMSDFCEDILRNTIAFPFVPHCLAERSHELVA